LECGIGNFDRWSEEWDHRRSFGETLIQYEVFPCRSYGIAGNLQANDQVPMTK
jgi:hypothetical protein